MRAVILALLTAFILTIPIFSFTGPSGGPDGAGEIPDASPVLGSIPEGSRVSEDGRFVYHTATEDDAEALRETLGTAQPGVNYNVLYDGLGTGLRPPTDDELDAIVGSVAIVDGLTPGAAASAPGYPSSLDLSTSGSFPQVRSQGSQGSCAAWASTYYCNGYAQAVDNGWTDAKTGNNAHLMSPAWTYNKANYGSDGGSHTWVCAQVVETVGCASWTTMPYNQADAVSWGSESAWRDAARYRCGQVMMSWPTFADSTINQIKGILENGSLVSFAFNASNFQGLFGDDILSSNEITSSYNHANTIVGWDDTLSSNGETGAFKMVNSWGNDAYTGDGFWWMTYDAFKLMQYPIVWYADREDDEPALLATWELDPQGGRNAPVQLGIGPKLSPVDTRAPSWSGGSTAFPSFMCLDVSEFGDDWPQATSFFLDIGYSSTASTITSFKMELYTEPYTAGSPYHVSGNSPDCPNSTPCQVTVDFYPPVDLIADSVSGPPAGETDHDITVTRSFSNDGDENSSMFAYSIYLSADDVITTDDFEIGSFPVESLESGGTNATAVDCHVTPWIGPGDYYLGMIVDVNGDMPETNEDNNTVASAGTVAISIGDDRYEENDAWGDAPLMAEGRYDFLRCLDDDWFRIFADAGDPINVTASFLASRGDLELELYDTDGTTLLASSCTSGDVEALEVAQLAHTGDHYFRIYGDGGDTNLYNMSAGIPPTINITSPEADDHISGVAPVQYTNSTDVVSVSFDYHDGSWHHIGTDDAPDGMFLWNTADLNKKDITLRATAMDDKGLEGTSTVTGIEIDNCAPTLSITSPAGGDHLCGKYMVTYDSASDVKRVRFEYFDGSWHNIGTDSSADGEYQWDTSGLNVSEASIKGIAVDEVGLEGENIVEGFEIDNLPPTFVLKSPKKGEHVGGKVTLKYEAADDVTGVKFRYHDGDSWTTIGNDGSIDGEYKWNTSALNLADVRIKGIATDDAGLTGSDSASGIEIDNEHPLLTISSPAGGEHITGIHTIKYTAAPDTGAITFEYFDVSWHTLGSDLALTGEFKWDTDGLNRNDVTLRAKAIDEMDHIYTVSVDNIELDNTAPLVRIMSPMDEERVEGLYTIKYHCDSDVDSIEFDYNDGSKWRDIGTDNGMTGSFKWNTSALDLYNISLRATATDDVGLVGQDKVTELSLDNAPWMFLDDLRDDDHLTGEVGIEYTTDPDVFEVVFEYLCDGTWYAIGVDNTTDGAYVWDTAGLDLEDAWIRATARDHAGLEGNHTVTGIEVDNTAPGIEITSPAPGENVTGVHTIEYTAANDTESILLEYTAGVRSWQKIVEDTSLSGFFNWNTHGLSDPAVTLRATVVDECGLVDSYTVEGLKVNWEEPEEEDPDDDQGEDGGDVDEPETPDGIDDWPDDDDADGTDAGGTADGEEGDDDGGADDHELSGGSLGDDGKDALGFTSPEGLMLIAVLFSIIIIAIFTMVALYRRRKKEVEAEVESAPEPPAEEVVWSEDPEYEVFQWEDGEEGMAPAGGVSAPKGRKGRRLSGLDDEDAAPRRRGKSAEGDRSKRRRKRGTGKKGSGGSKTSKKEKPAVDWDEDDDDDGQTADVDWDADDDVEEWDL